MLSKCANAECCEEFRYLHLGKLFCLAPKPQVEAINAGMIPTLSEQFWLGERCSKTMTLAWAGTHATVVALPAKPGKTIPAKPARPTQRGRAARAASPGR